MKKSGEYDILRCYAAQRRETVTQTAALTKNARLKPKNGAGASEAVENKGVLRTYEIRHRSFLPISVLRSNLYEIPQSLMAQGVRDLTSPCTLMFQYELPRKNVAEMWRRPL